MKTTPAPVRSHRTARRRAWWAMLRQFFTQQRKPLLLGLLLAWCTTLMGCMLLGLSGWFITSTAIAGLSTATALMFDVFTPSASIRLLALGRTASRYAERLVTHDATLAVLVALREKLFHGWARPEAAGSLQLRPARLLFRLTRDLDTLENLYLRLLVPAVAALGTAVALAIFTGFLHPLLGIGSLLWLAGMGLGIAWWMGRQSILPSARHAQALERLRSRTIDLVAGQTDLLMAQQWQAQRQRVLQADARISAIDQTLNRIEVRGIWAFSLAQSVGLAAALLAGGWLVQTGQAGAPVAALLVLLALAASEPFAGLRRGMLELGKTWLAARRLAQPLGHAGSQPATEAVALPPPPAELAVQARQLQYRYWPESTPLPPALHPLNLEIRRGEHLAIVGPSGCGKSTLLALLAGELPSHDGMLAALPAAWLTQRTELFQDSVRGNLNLAQLALDDSALWQALEAAGLAQDIRQSRDGLDTWLGEGGLGLSGGQSRRLALARLFLSPQPLWLLDEPTEGLDTATATEVLARLHQQATASGRTLVIATHLQREAALAQRVLHLRHGRLTESAARGQPDFERLTRLLRSG